MAVNPTPLATFRGIKRFVDLMLENRSFDHLVGFLRETEKVVRRRISN